MASEVLTKTKYQELMQNPAVYLKDPKLKTCTVAKDMFGLPKVSSGGFALTFKFTSKSNVWALRCFHKISTMREEYYNEISKFLRQNPSKSFVNIEYQADGIRYQNKYYPLTLMEWIQGQTLETYIYNNFTNKNRMSDLVSSFRDLVRELNRLKIAHGDLSHSNIMLSDQQMKLIDYDGMFVPNLRGKISAEIGNRNFQHPQRDNAFFSEKIDWFSEIVLYLALKAIATDPKLYREHGIGQEGLLFSEKDFISPESSKLIGELKKNKTLREEVAQFCIICQSDLNAIPSLDSFIAISKTLKATPTVPRPEPPPIPKLGPHPTNLPIAGTDKEKLLAQENINAVVIAKIKSYKLHETDKGKKCLFLNVGNRQRQTFSVVIWEEVFNMLLQEIKKASFFENKWVSVSGVITKYKGRPQIVLESPARIREISETEANQQLESIKWINPNNEKSIWIDIPPAFPKKDSMPVPNPPDLLSPWSIPSKESLRKQLIDWLKRNF